eukprot:CAMPEP_0113617916 /NCGR_PEP_ID=MMETSP0017_2-20120614/9051_1 /TAXON_ID=2856 /ORGANISM="Cylindrotheca closterium" /LENGTH=219 /DNA_ID=CAMNT_0000527375 /DNA_START=94 /DNA_END=753 /DNA_ORIENTATION=+ /assembly_acc=CAM_ASM_000147
MAPSVQEYGEASVDIECNTDNTTKPISSEAGGMKRNVSFSDQDDIRHIESKKSISKKERKTRWMMTKDFIRIRENCESEMMRMFHSDKPCMRVDIRGLELFDPETICRSRSKHRKIVNAVIRMQDKQNSQGTTNPESIREMYCYLVQDSKDDARAIAWIDREVVEDYMATTETEYEQLQETKAMEDLAKTVSSKREGKPTALRQRLLKPFRSTKKVPSS